MRRRPDSFTEDRSDPVTRRRANVSGATRKVAVRARRGRNSNRVGPIRSKAVALVDPGVVDDFPAAIPVSKRELEVIETYLSDLLDRALRPG
jgi:hypothetical protein